MITNEEQSLSHSSSIEQNNYEVRWLWVKNNLYVTDHKLNKWIRKQDNYERRITLSHRSSIEGCELTFDLIMNKEYSSKQWSSIERSELFSELGS
jgi:hypothetical protein